MRSVTESRYIPVSPANIAALLLRPLDLPTWNPAFLSMSGSGDPIVGDPHSMTVVGGLRGTFEYARIDPAFIAMEWDAPGLHEYCDWTLVSQSSGTLVTHLITRTGPLSVPLRTAMAGLPGLRFERLARALQT